MKTKHFIVFVILAAGIFSGSCLYTSSDKKVDSVAIALDWNRFVLDAEVETEGYRGPVASRAYGYVGLAAYEAAFPGLARGYQSLAQNYPGMKLPIPPETEYYNLAIALNASYSTILSYFFLSSPETIKNKHQKLRNKWEDILKSGVDSLTFISSVQFGQAVGKAVFEWSATDSIGYRANHHN